MNEARSAINGELQISVQVSRDCNLQIKKIVSQNE